MNKWVLIQDCKGRFNNQNNNSNNEPCQQTNKENLYDHLLGGEKHLTKFNSF